MNPHVMLRRAAAADLEAVVPLFDAYRVFYKQHSDLAGARVFLAARFAQGDSVIYVAVQGGTPVGFVQLYPSFSSVSMRRLWILNDLFVDPQARGRAVGAQLIAAAQAWATETKAKGLVLETAKTNPAEKLYRRMGFELDKASDHYAWIA